MINDKNELDERFGGYSTFQRMAESPQSVDSVWRVGFDSEVRIGFEQTIVDNIMAHLDSFCKDFLQLEPTFVDIGGGSSELTLALNNALIRRNYSHIIVESPEMLKHLPSDVQIRAVEGRFPDNLEILREITSKPSAILVYSVMQYVVKDGILDEFLDGIFALMEPGSISILGDLPNNDMRNRKREASNLRLEFSDARPISDSLIMEIMRKCNDQGLNTYLTYQFRDLPLSAHRLDLILHKPTKYVGMSDNE